MRFGMGFFTRCKTLSNVLKLVCLVIAIILAINISTGIDDIKMGYDSGIYYILGCVIFAFMLIIVVILECIVKDAKEDFEALLRTIEHTEEKKDK